MLRISDDMVNRQHYIYDEIRTDGRPVVIYGAGEVGRLVTALLRAHGIEPFAFAVDRVYYREGTEVEHIRVCPYEEFLAAADDYLFLLGIGGPANRVRAFLNDVRGRRMAVTTPYGEYAPMDAGFLRANEERLQETYAWLADDLSKETMQAYVDLKLSGDLRSIFDVFEEDQYFNNISVSARGGAFVDCGAFTGDSAEAFVRWSGGTCKRVIALEPDAHNYALLQENMKRYPFPVTTYPVGAWSGCDVLRFQTKESQGTGTHVSDEGEFAIHVDALDHLIDDQVDFIKMDIEGAEMRALAGAQKLICRYHPMLAIAVYHKSEDLVTIPQYIKTFDTPDVIYRLYLRKHHIGDELELDLYAVPEKR